MKPLLVIAGMAVATALVSGALLVGQGPGAGAPSPAAGPAPASAPPAAEDRAAVVELERKVRSLEARIAELVARSDSIPSLPGASHAEEGGHAKAVALEEPGPEGASAVPSVELVEPEISALRELAMRRLAAPTESRRDAELRRRIDRAVLAMSLTGQERNRVEEIARAHIDRADAIALRAKEALKDSPFGFSEADRALVEQLSQDRARLDKETEQSLVLLVGADRWKAGLKAEKDQDAKEKAVKRLEKPW
jgi:hypothetical protein